MSDPENFRKVFDETKDVALSADKISGRGYHDSDNMFSTSGAWVRGGGGQETIVSDQNGNTLTKKEWAGVTSGKDLSGKFSRGGSSGSSIEAEMTTPSTNGDVRYEASIEGPGPKSTKITRYDSNGNEVYSHESDSPAMAHKVGAIAAKKIVEFAEKTPSAEKAA